MGMDRATGRTIDTSQRARAWVTADEWFSGGRRIWYDPASARVPGDDEAARTPGALRVFERVVGDERAARDADTGWLTMLPGFPDGSYGWAQVDRLLADDPVPRLYVEPIGQGDSDKPERRHQYTTIERADLIEALWRHHGVRRTVVVSFDFTSLALLELLRRQAERTDAAAHTTIAAAFMINGGLFADAHTHPLRGTPMLRSPLGALAARGSQRSAAVFAQGWQQARMYSRGYHPASTELTELWSALTRHDGAAFMHDGAGFVKEHRRHARRWDLAAVARELNGAVGLYIGGSDEDPYEHRQIAAARERVPEAEIITFPGGHLTTSEHPGLLAEAIRRIYSTFDTERSSS
jgi:pimeloyl-ACP methyl ester carboxylesterase